MCKAACWELIIDCIATIVSIVGACISVGVFRHSVKRERKILTLDVYSKIRNEQTTGNTDEDKLDYLREMEFFCTGINSKIYDFNILRKMSGRRLYKQYEDDMKDFISNRRKNGKASEVSWIEYEKVMKRLKCYYCTDKNRFIKLICEKRH